MLAVKSEITGDSKSHCRRDDLLQRGLPGRRCIYPLTSSFRKHVSPKNRYAKCSWIQQVSRLLPISFLILLIIVGFVFALIRQPGEPPGPSCAEPPHVPDDS